MGRTLDMSTVDTRPGEVQQQPLPVMNSSGIDNVTRTEKQPGLFSTLFSRRGSTTDQSNNESSSSFFGSNQSFWDLKDNFLGRLESAFQSTTEVPQAKRKIKDRSVFGQPEVSVCNLIPSMRLKREFSRESLDSGHSLTSSRVSTNDLMHLDAVTPVKMHHSMYDSSVGIGSSVESSDVEDNWKDELENERCQSRSSVISVSSDDYPEDASHRLIREFMKHFVDDIFNEQKSISSEEKSMFGNFCQTDVGRKWFARFVNEQVGTVLVFQHH